MWETKSTLNPMAMSVVQRLMLSRVMPKRLMPPMTPTLMESMAMTAEATEAGEGMRRTHTSVMNPSAAPIVLSAIVGSSISVSA